MLPVTNFLTSPVTGDKVLKENKLPREICKEAPLRHKTKNSIHRGFLAVHLLSKVVAAHGKYCTVRKKEDNKRDDQRSKISFSWSCHTRKGKATVRKGHPTSADKILREFAPLKSGTVYQNLSFAKCFVAECTSGKIASRHMPSLTQKAMQIYVIFGKTDLFTGSV